MIAKSNRTSPFVIFGLIALLLSLGSAIALHFFISLNLAISWLISVNMTALLLYGYDKIQAIRDEFRVPEKIMHTIVLIGGGIGGLAAMIIFRHKIRKAKFQLVFWIILALQIAGAITWLIPK